MWLNLGHHVRLENLKWHSLLTGISRKQNQHLQWSNQACSKPRHFNMNIARVLCSYRRTIPPGTTSRTRGIHLIPHVCIRPPLSWVRRWFVSMMYSIHFDMLLLLQTPASHLRTSRSFVPHPKDGPMFRPDIQALLKQRGLCLMAGRFVRMMLGFQDTALNHYSNEDCVVFCE